MRTRFSVATHAAPGPAYVDYLVDFLLARVEASEPRPGQRLAALEQTLVALTLPWRGATTISPAKAIRMSGATLDRLLGWLEAEAAPSGTRLERLAVYASGALTDPSVPDGWLRVRLAVNGARR
jgi:hypothetical protein